MCTSKTFFGHLHQKKALASFMRQVGDALIIIIITIIMRNLNLMIIKDLQYRFVNSNLLQHHRESLQLPSVERCLHDAVLYICAVKMIHECIN